VKAGSVEVLLVHRYRLSGESLERALRVARGIDVTGVAASAAEAIELSTRLSPDVVILDVRLPEEHGAEVASRILDLVPSTAIILLADAEDDALLLRALESGCSGCVNQAQSVDEVIAAIRTVHGGEALVDPTTIARLLPRLRRRDRTASLLTPREIEILHLVAQGVSTAQIAERLEISRHTVRNHVQRSLEQLGAHSKGEAVAKAIRAGLIQLLEAPDFDVEEG
jgi:DNA-binding NarL/FixJ family response regulator